MGPRGLLRALEAEERRRQRDAQRQQRELERRKKEQAKLSAIELAHLEVETYENRLEVLLSVHKEQETPWDWVALAAALPPACPQKSSYHELQARQRVLVLHPERQQGVVADEESGADDCLLKARQLQEKLKFILEGEAPRDIFSLKAAGATAHRLEPRPELRRSSKYPSVHGD